MPQGLLDRLALDPQRVAAVAQALRDVAALPDPVGEVVRGSTLANGLQIRQVRVPMGVVGMVYEARPNVTVDAAGLGLKSGNAVILRGGSAAESTNRALVEVMRAALVAQGLPADAVTLLEGGRDAVRALLTARGLVDLIIPRGGAGLIQTVVHRVDRAGDRDRRRQLPRLRRRGGRPRQGARDHGQRQDPPAQRLQRRRVAARPRGRRRRLPAQGAGRALRGRGGPAHRRRPPAPRPSVPGCPTRPRPRRTGAPSTSPSR